jgi:hypothetical protein
MVIGYIYSGGDMDEWRALVNTLMNGGEFVDQMRNCYIRKNKSAAWGYSHMKDVQATVAVDVRTQDLQHMKSQRTNRPCSSVCVT